MHPLLSLQRRASRLGAPDPTPMSPCEAKLKATQADLDAMPKKHVVLFLAGAAAGALAMHLSMKK